MLKVIQAILIAIVVAAMLIASFYFAYVLVLLLVLTVVGGLAYTIISWDDINSKPYLND